MTFRPGAQLDPSEVQDARGGRGSGGFGGGGRLGGSPIVVGGGGLGLLVTLVLVVLNSGVLGGTSPGAILGAPGDPQASSAADCRTGAQANAREDCRIVGFVDSVQAFWKEEFLRAGQTYDPATTILFTDQTGTGCGTATTAVGPFYCPAD